MNSALDLANYKLTFSDEFNSFSSNGPSNPSISSHTGTWDTTYSYGERKLNDEIQLYSDPTIGVDPFSNADGVLVITAAPSTDLPASWRQPYTSGAITTFHSFAQQYGYFEMRAQLPEGAGMWPAFWMLPVRHMWPPELDPLEAFGSNGPSGDAGAYSFHSGLVQTGSGGQGAWHSTNGANLYAQYNTFGVAWERDTITFYFNGEAHASMATPAEFHQPMYLLANLAVGGNWAGAPVGETATLKIDYIRAFSKDGSNPAITQQRVSSPDGRGYSFFGATDADGNGALGGVDLPAPLPTTAAPIPPAPAGDQAVGTGPDNLSLYMSEDYYLGDAQFIITVDGTQIGGILSTSASHAAGETQAFSVFGSFGVGTHTVGVNFLNNFGGAPGVDRNLFVSGASINGLAIEGAVLNEYAGGAQSFSFTRSAAASSVHGPPKVLAGTPGDDAFTDGPQNQSFIGGGGHDVLTLDEGRQGATFSLLENGGVSFTHRGQTDILLSIEEVRFIDGREVFDPADPAAAVTRLYQAGLGRAPEQGGLNFWIASLQGGSTLASLAASFLSCPEFTARFGTELGNSDFVVSLYRNVLGRDPEAGGLAFWRGSLDSSRLSRGEALAGISESAENRAATAAQVAGGVWDTSETAAQVARLYDTALGRLPDEGGLGFWTRAIEGGRPLAELAGAFVNSSEFRSTYGNLEDRPFVNAIYSNVLGRAGEAAEVDFWAGILAGGTPRAQVVVGFSESAEHQAGFASIIGTALQP